MNSANTTPALHLTPTLHKNELRTLLRKKRKEIPPAEHTHLSAQAAQHLLNSPIWIEAKTIFLTISCAGEIATTALLSAALEQKKRIGLPLCLQEPGKMLFLEYSGPEDLQPGRYGIMEPKYKKQAVITDLPNLVVVPGVAFDLLGGRLGMGGGYYDRYFSQNNRGKAFLAGFCFGFQIVPKVPTEAWDLTMHAICSEQGFISVKK